MREATSHKGDVVSMPSHYAESQGKPRYGEKTPHHGVVPGTL